MKPLIPQQHAFLAVLEAILASAKAQGITGKELAQRAGITPETLSRMRTRGSGDFGVVDTLARMVGYRLALTPDDDTLAALREGRLF